MLSYENTIENFKNCLLQLAESHVPEASTIDSVIDQWLHAIATNNDFFVAYPEKRIDIKKEAIKLLKKNKLYNKRNDFFDIIYKNLNITPNYNENFTFIDLFAGIGGLRIAAQNNNGVCVFSSEFDKFAQTTYKLNHGEMPFGDIKKINPSSIPNHDLLLAGFPCQPFSYSGKTEGFQDQTRGTLFFDILRIIELKSPKVVLLENVKGFKSHDKGKTMQTALDAIQQLGYSTSWTILNSYHFGVPQFRERWYCVAIRENKVFDFPKPEGIKTTLRDIVDLSDKSSHLFLTEFELKRIEYHFQQQDIEVRVKHDSSMYEKNTKKGKHGVFSYLKPDGALRFHVGDYAKTQIQEAFYSCLDTYAPTIIANRVPKLWDIKRRLSVNESLKLQGFPSCFKFNISNAQAYKQIGNSVTIPVVDRIISNLILQGIL